MGQTVKTLVFNGILAGKYYDDLSAEVQQLLADNNVKEQSVREILLQGANDAISQIALQSPVSLDEYERLFGILEGFDNYSYRSEFAARRWYSSTESFLSFILWQVLHDVHPGLPDAVEFNLRPGEKPLYQTDNIVTYLEERTVSNHVRSFGGLSLPVGAGVYYHIGGSQGNQERTSGLLPLDGGKILITSHALYFGGQKTTLRIPLDRVLRYQPYVDGVGVCESHGAPKVFTFNHGGMDTGWFFYNLLSALTNNLIQEGSPFSTSARTVSTTTTAPEAAKPNVLPPLPDKEARPQTSLSQPQVVKHERGIVKWFDAGKGFGFITGQSGEDIFVHFSCITELGHRVLEEGEQVEYIVVKRSHGIQAENVRKVVGPAK